MQHVFKSVASSTFSKQFISTSQEAAVSDRILKIKTEVIEVTLDDQGSPWDSKTKPKHKFL